jgi:hypothetical protein
MKKKSIIIGALTCLIMGCSGPDSGKKENSSVGQDTIMPATKSDTISAKKEEEKQPHQTALTSMGKNPNYLFRITVHKALILVIN